MTPAELRALAAIGAGGVALRVRRAPYHSVSGVAPGQSRVVSKLIAAGLARHDRLVDRAVVPVTLTDKGRVALASVAP